MPASFSLEAVVLALIANDWILNKGKVWRMNRIEDIQCRWNMVVNLTRKNCHALNPRILARSVSNCFFANSSGVFSFLGLLLGRLDCFSMKPRPPQRSISPPEEDAAFVVKPDSNDALTALFAATFADPSTWCPVASSSIRTSSILSKTL